MPARRREAVAWNRVTIRDYLKRQRNKRALLVLPGIVFCVLSAMYAPGNFWLNWLSLAALFAGLVAIIVLMRRTPCPRCGLPLGAVAVRAAGGRATTGHCPHCKVSINAPMNVTVPAPDESKSGS
jgi:hypothetical protein